MTRQAPEVGTSAGRVRGRWRGDSAAFLGIPFAEAPVGDRRLASPVPHARWDGVREALEHGATPQRRALAEVTLIPEPSVPGSSTLNVDVYTPDPGGDARLPVLVWIHGGGFIAGSPASPWYDGAAFNRDGIVTVSVSYRLGLDGFGVVAGAPDNRGVRDWLLALAWVQENIAAFGGDPSRVTIAGQSAGGAAVFALFAIPAAEGLFAQGMALSGANPEADRAATAAATAEVAQRAGVSPDRTGLVTVPEDRILELQASPGGVGDADPMTELAKLAGGRLPWGVVPDGDLVPASVLARLAAPGDPRPLTLCTTDNEFNMALRPAEDQLAAVPLEPVFAQLGVDEREAVAYIESHPGLSHAGVLGQWITDRMFRRIARSLAEGRAETGRTWLSRFSWQSPTLGAAHCLDVPFYFDCLRAERIAHLAGEAPPESLATDVHGAAVRFITAGDPGWPAYRVPERDVRVYDVPSTVAPDAYADAAQTGAPGGVA